MYKMRIAVLAATTAALLSACGQDPYKPKPAILSVEPDTLVTGRSHELLITGAFTKWNENTQVDLGGGVTVDGEITVVSSEMIQVPVTVDGQAEAGPRDVQVTTGGQALDLTQYVEVQPIFTAENGALQQGGLGFVHLNGNQTGWVSGLSTPVAGTLDASGAPTAISAVPVVENVISADEMSPLMLADLFVQSGDYDMFVLHKDQVQEARGIFEITASEKTAEELTDGAASSQSSISGELDYNLFRITGVNPGDVLKVEVQGTEPFPTQEVCDFFGCSPVAGVLSFLYQPSAGGGLPVNNVAVQTASGSGCQTVTVQNGGEHYLTVFDFGTVIKLVQEGPAAQLQDVSYPIDYTITVTINGAC